MDASDLVRMLTDERAHFVRVARRSLPSEADADDAVQHAMVKAVEHAGSLENAARVRPWFGRIVRRTVADFYRSRPPEPLRDVAPDDAVAEAVELPGRPCMCSVRLLDELRPAYAEVLRRLDLDGASPEAVSRALGVSTATLHVRLHRARHALRERVKKHCGVSTCGPCLDCTCDAQGRCGHPKPSRTSEERA